MALRIKWVQIITMQARYKNIVTKANVTAPINDRAKNSTYPQKTTPAQIKQIFFMPFPLFS